MKHKIIISIIIFIIAICYHVFFIKGQLDNKKIERISITNQSQAIKSKACSENLPFFGVGSLSLLRRLTYECQQMKCKDGRPIECNCDKEK